MSAADLKGAIIGTGFFAQFHADAWARIPGVRVAAVADPAVERAREFAARWGVPSVYGDAEEMLAAERPDFVDIVTRPDSHLPLVRLAADHRIPIICQKPMAPTVEECREMVEVTGRADVRLVIHENWRWQPWYREIQRMGSSGVFGHPYYLAVFMRTGDGRGAEPYQVQPYFRQMPRFLIYETLVHFLDTLRFLGGEIARLSCTTDRLNPVIAGEDAAIIELRFLSGARGLIDANRIAGQAPPPVAFGEFRMEGDRGAVRMLPDGTLLVTEYGSPERVQAFEKPETGYKGDSVLGMQTHFVECLRSGRPAESEAAEYMKTVSLVEACYRSSQTGLPQELA